MAFERVIKANHTSYLAAGRDYTAYELGRQQDFACMVYGWLDSTGSTNNINPVVVELENDHADQTTSKITMY